MADQLSNAHKISRSLIKKAIELNKEAIRLTGKPLGRKKLSDSLGIPMSKARDITIILSNMESLNELPTEMDEEPQFGKIFVLSDLHIPLHHQEAYELAVDYGEKWDPDLILILGDWIDLDVLSKWDSSRPTGFTAEDEFRIAKQMLRELKERFKKKKFIFYYGNHEERLEKYILRKAKDIYDLIGNVFINSLGLSDLEIEFREDPFNINGFWFLHGHETKSRATIYTAASLYRKMGVSGLAGHFHRRDNYTQILADGTAKRFFINACLQARTTYAKIPTFELGFATVEFKSNIPEVKLFKIENGIIHL